MTGRRASTVGQRLHAHFDSPTGMEPIVIQLPRQGRAARHTFLALASAAVLLAGVAGCGTSSTSAQQSSTTPTPAPTPASSAAASPAPTAAGVPAGTPSVSVASNSVPVTGSLPRPALRPGVASRLRVGSQWVNVLCTGAPSKEPTIVLVAGEQDPLTKFTALQATLSKTARVCSYDRPGEGASPAPAAQQSLPGAAALLDGVLQAAGVDGKVVLVGHSLGGLVATEFSHRYLPRVAALVLLDASAPSVGGAIETLIPSTATGAAAEARAEASGLSSAAMNTEKLVYSGAPIPSLGSLRMTVVQHGQPIYSVLPQYATRLQAIWTTGQHQLTQLSSRGTLVTAPKSGHYIYLDQPALTVQLIDHATAG